MTYQEKLKKLKELGYKGPAVKSEKLDEMIAQYEAKAPEMAVDPVEVEAVEVETKEEPEEKKLHIAENKGATVDYLEEMGCVKIVRGGSYISYELKGKKFISSYGREIKW